MNLADHANDAESIRAAAEYARGIMDNLKSIGTGIQTAHERGQRVEQVDRWFCALAAKLGYKVERI